MKYETTDHEYTYFQLGEVSAIRSANGASIDVYPLTERAMADGEPSYVAWLDADLRLARFDGACWSSTSQECTHQTLTWRLEGLPWILGLDTGLSLPAASRATYSSWGQPMDALPTLHRTKTHTVATFEPGNESLRIPFAGTLAFAHGAIYPDDVQLVQSGALVPIHLRLVEADESARKRLAEPTTDHLVFAEKTVAQEGRLFLGETDDTFDVGYSHASLMDNFLSEVERPGQMLARGGCLIDYSLWPEDSTDMIGALDSHKIASMAIRILTNDGHGVRWDVDVEDGAFGLSFQVKDESEFNKTWTCHDVEHLPLPALSIGDFLEHASRRVTTHLGTYGFQVVREPMPSMPGGIPGSSLFGTRFTSYFEPENAAAVSGGGVRKTPYHFTMHAEAERMLEAIVHPDDAQNFA